MEDRQARRRGEGGVNEDVRSDLKIDPQSTRNLLNAVNHASEAALTGWLIYLGLAAYFIVALAGVTHKDLLLNSPISLPVLSISISLDRFFLFAPPLFIIIHLGMMMQYEVLTRKIYAFLHVIEREEREMADAGAPAGQIHPLRYELSSNFFTQFLAGPNQAGILTFMQQMIVWATLIMLAAIVLMMFQVTFLPYHDVALTWAHRVYVLIDLVIVGIVGTFLPSPLHGFWASTWYSWRNYPTFMTITVGFFAAFFAFSFFLATVPGERLDRLLAAIGPSVEVPAPSGRAADMRTVFLPIAYLFDGAIDERSGASLSPFQRNLVVMDQDLVNGRDLAPDSRSISLRNRDLRYARLDRSDLKQADMTGADLTGASLDGTVLTGVRR